MRVILFIILSLFFVWQVMAASLSDTYLTKVKHGLYSSATQAQLNNIYGHTTSSGNPHGTTAEKVPYTPTGNITETDLQTALAGVDTRMPQVCVNVYDGAPALSCAIDSGIAAFTYSAFGADPLPAMLPYTVKLYEVGLNNNEPVTADSIAWTVPASNSLLFGNATTATFTPTLDGTYSANKTNWIKATLTKGLKTCIALLPISITKEGTAGEKGDTGNPAALGTITANTVAYGNPASAVYSGPSTARNLVLNIPEGAPGAAADVTKASVQTVYTMNAVSGGTFTVRPYTTNSETNATELIVAGDEDGNKRLIVTGDTTTLNTLGGTADTLVVNKLFPGYGVPLVNAWSERFTAIRTNDTVSVTAGKTYTETITLFADGTITAASINFRTPNGDHIVPAYVTGTQTGGYTLTATYTTETGGTTIRMPDITYLAGTATTITITAASLVQQKTNLIIDAAALSGIYEYNATRNTIGVAQSDGSYRVRTVDSFGVTNLVIQREITRALSSSTSYTAEVIYRHDGTSNLNTFQWVMGLTPSGARQTGGTATLTDLGNGFKKMTATRATASDEISVVRFPEWNVASDTGTRTYYDVLSTKLILDSEAAPATTNLYTGSFDDLYHYTAAHTTTATAQTRTVKKLSVSSEGALTLW